jgi:galactokinase
LRYDHKKAFYHDYFLSKMQHDNIQQVVEKYEALYHKKPDVVVISPGRINIIGEHIDYNAGFVLPAAINKAMVMALGKNEAAKVQLHALNYQEDASFDLVPELSPKQDHWSNYAKGVCQQLTAQNYHYGGLNGVLMSDIPIGAGLSSSAALECGLLFGLNQLYDLKIPPVDLAVLGQKAEHWVGVKCGIMDQFASVLGQEKSVIKIDCQDLSYEYYPADFQDYNLVLFNSGVSHSLAASEYNIRRQECEQGLAILQENFPEIRSFRNAQKHQLESLSAKMPNQVFKRCLFVIEEIERVNQACEALQTHNLPQLGSLMFETHWGLSELYEVSCPELDFLVMQAAQSPAILGARVMGGGFGGCTINLIHKAQQADTIKHFKQKFEAEFGIALESYEVEIQGGTRLANDAAIASQKQSV